MMAELADMAGHKMSAGTGLHDDGGCITGGKKSGELSTGETSCVAERGHGTYVCRGQYR